MWRFHACLFFTVSLSRLAVVGVVAADMADGVDDVAFLVAPGFGDVPFESGARKGLPVQGRSQERRSCLLVKWHGPHWA